MSSRAVLIAKLTSLSIGLSRSVNEVICHGIPDRRKLVDGDIVNIGAVFGYSIRSIVPGSNFYASDVSLYYDGMYFASTQLSIKV